MLMIDSNEDSKMLSPKQSPRIQQLLTLIPLAQSTSQSLGGIKPVKTDRTGRGVQHDSVDVRVFSPTSRCSPDRFMVKRVKGDRKYGGILKSTRNRSAYHNTASIKDEPVDLSNDHKSEQAHVDVKTKSTDVEQQTTITANNPADVIIKSEPADVEHQTTATVNNRADVIIKREPADVEHQTTVTANNRTDVIIKKEAADEDSEVTSTGDDSADVEDVLSPDAATVKQELDIGLTVLQPPDTHFKLLPCKPELLANSVDVLRHRRSANSACEQHDSRRERSSEKTKGNKQAVAKTNHRSGRCSEKLDRQDHASGGSLRFNISNIKRKRSEYPFRCNVCSKGFKFQSPLTEHLRIHTGHRPFSCDVCSKRFTQKSNLTVHKAAHSIERRYSCAVCNKRFKYKYSLLTHMMLHTEHRPFSCEVCSKSFILKSHLTNHMVIHSNEHRYSCMVCNKRFKYKYFLTTHLKTGERLYSCDVCSKCIK